MLPMELLKMEGVGSVALLEKFMSWIKSREKLRKEKTNWAQVKEWYRSLTEHVLKHD